MVHHPHMADIQFKLRLPGELHARLDADARENGRSVTAEIVARLERSFPLSINEQIRELRRREVADLQDFIARVSEASQELRRRVDSGSMSPDQRESCEALLENSVSEIARARTELEIAQQRLEGAIKDETEWMARHL